MKIGALNNSTGGMSLEDFNRIASGKYNAGVVSFDGKGGLKAVNNHVTMRFLNTAQVDKFEVFAVKTAFLKALEDKGVDATMLNVIRGRLGLNKDLVFTGETSLGLAEKPLTRQEVRKIIDDVARYVKDEGHDVAEHKAASRLEKLKKTTAYSGKIGAKAKEFVSSGITGMKLAMKLAAYQKEVNEATVNNLKTKYYAEYMAEHAVMPEGPDISGVSEEKRREIGEARDKANSSSPGSKSHVLDDLREILYGVHTNVGKDTRAFCSKLLGAIDMKVPDLAKKSGGSRVEDGDGLLKIDDIVKEKEDESAMALASTVSRESVLSKFGVCAEEVLDGRKSAVVLTQRVMNGLDVTMKLPDITLAEFRRAVEMTQAS